MLTPIRKPALTRGRYAYHTCNSEVIGQNMQPCVVTLEDASNSDAPTIEDAMASNKPVVATGSILRVEHGSRSDFEINLFSQPSNLFLLPDPSTPVSPHEAFQPQCMRMQWSDFRIRVTSPPSETFLLYHSNECTDCPALRYLIGADPPMSNTLFAKYDHHALVERPDFIPETSANERKSLTISGPGAMVLEHGSQGN